MDSDKSKIIFLFRQNVKGKNPKIASYKYYHDGQGGHWLERQMNIKANASNSPDIYGYEMKSDTTSKTTFGDWSADYYIFKDTKANINRDLFLKIFGKPNAKKNNRYSWSGEPCPNVRDCNKFGQKIIVPHNNDIEIIYNFFKDQRSNKNSIIPKNFRKRKLVLARWDYKSIKSKLENKFNKKGWFKCLQNPNGIYVQIVFGDPINFREWIRGVKSGDIFFDSAMYQGNPRNYSQWRARNSFWDKLVTSKYS